eukprot:941037-Rhodomonas_salina.1
MILAWRSRCGAATPAGLRFRVSEPHDCPTAGPITTDFWYRLTWLRFRRTVTTAVQAGCSRVKRQASSALHSGPRLRVSQVR